MKISNFRYRGSVEDQVHQTLSSRLAQIRDIFGTIPDTLEDVWVATALGEVEEARRRIEEVPPRHPFDLRYAQDLPETAWERCEQVLDQYDVQRLLRESLATGADADKLTEVMTVGRQVPRALRGELLQRFAELPRDRADPGLGEPSEFWGPTSA